MGQSRIWNIGKISVLLSRYSSESRVETAERLGVSPQAVRQKLYELAKAGKIPPLDRRKWKDDEVALVRENIGYLRPGYCPEEFGRSLIAARNMMRRNGIRQLESGIFRGTYRMSQVAAFFGVSSRTIRRWIERGLLPAVLRPTVGGRRFWVIYLGDLIEFLENFTDVYDRDLVPRRVGARGTGEDMANPLAPYLPPPAPDPYLSPKQAARELGVTTGTIIAIVSDGLLPKVTFANRYAGKPNHIYLPRTTIVRIALARRPGEPVRQVCKRLLTGSCHDGRIHPY